MIRNPFTSTEADEFIPEFLRSQELTQDADEHPSPQLARTSLSGHLLKHWDKVLVAVLAGVALYYGSWLAVLGGGW